ncbi:MAG: HAMP domain-containing protein [Neptuniibacter sp.]|nr:HAMP domain-containing protein [Neptuniibacter sp.]
MSLRLKTILGIATIEALLLLLLVSMTLDYLRSTNYEGLTKRASTTATLFATTTKDAVLSYDLASLEAFVTEVMKNPDLVYARVLGPQGTVFAQAGEASVLGLVFQADKDVEQITDGVFDTFAEISEGGKTYGRVELGIDINSLTETINEAKQKSATIAALEMALVALFSLILGTYLTKQLNVLTKAAKSISRGRLDIEVPVSGHDEVADVAKAFNSMAGNLKEVSARRDEFELELRKLNQSLEQRVEKRTQQLQEKNSQLEQANREIKETQAQLVHSEKMASVGILAAGVAHEINNPMGFVISNISTLELYVQNYRKLLESYQKLAAADSSQERKQLLEEIQGLEQEVDLEFMSEDIEELMNDTKEGTNRVKEIVKGLKEFSHVDQSENFHMADINACIETTLKVVNNELKYHCELVTELGELPDIYCAPGQIKQVLLNLLLNAGHSIEDKGTITITTECMDDQIKICIQDTGCGIDEHQMDKLFDPFFTTKSVGEGTGLGLAISYGIIVDEHKGNIEVSSEVGKGTEFTITLPVVTQPD